MRTPELSERDRRALRLGALVLAPALFLGLVVRPYLDTLSDARSRLHAERQLFAREVELATGAERYRERGRAASEALAAEATRLFRAEDEQLALAELSAYVSERARRSRVLVLETGSRGAAPADGGVRAIRLELQAESDLEGILTLLGRLETGPKLVRVDDLRIEADRPRGADGYEALRVDMGVVAYTLADRSEAAAPPDRGPRDGRAAGLPASGRTLGGADQGEAGGTE